MGQLELLDMPRVLGAAMLPQQLPTPSLAFGMSKTHRIIGSSVTLLLLLVPSPLPVVQQHSLLPTRLQIDKCFKTNMLLVLLVVRIDVNRVAWGFQQHHTLKPYGTLQLGAV